MRVVQVAPFYHPVIGGVEEVVERIAGYMASKGNEVYVVTYNRLRVGGEGFLPKEETINNVHIVRLKPNTIRSHGTYSTELPEVLRRLRPDLVHVHVWRHPHVFQVAKLKQELGSKMVLHGHAPFYNVGQLGFVTWAYHRLADLFMKGILRKYDSMIALTPYERRILVGKLGVEEDKVAVIPNGIDNDLLRTAENSTLSNNADAIVLYVGRVSKEKNVDLLVRAMDYVIREIENAKLVLAGPDEGIWSKLVEHQKTVSIKYVGAVNETVKLKLYISSKVFANPATYEGFGITLLEAQAFGKPCVITSEGGQVYAAPPGRTSLHVKPNPKDFGKAISLLLNDRELYDKLSVNAKEWASRHSWSKILPKYDEVYS